MQTKHHVSGRNMYGDFPDGLEKALFGMGCFWGAERLFWQAGGVYVTSVGYGGGAHNDSAGNPNYDQVCSGATGHVELVQVVFAPDILPYTELLKIFFENHNPTQGDCQGNDMGSQYRSVIYTASEAQHSTAIEAKARYNEAYAKAGKNLITTTVETAPTYYPAEDYHQQYLAKNPGGYCNIGGTGVTCPAPKIG
ncbi:MAG: peptide-methionine (S)-S-oxide reductase MsrA [Robiginitomaculum sp.]|nr:peptide-methionine (S)-S-oxide reductase MsrA [Robiginitomaculum sp.]